MSVRNITDGRRKEGAMPRPGPRPYECVKRAWHSERHKPLRGSIIQHIFRLVGEAHSMKTKNNREWQEKLPIVVLKCEEILYSKANSDAEYLDQETLWGRVSDAVKTIIRLEEVNETGKLLPPCVEAALTLGCVPVKSSRSQRHCNARTYLTARSRDLNGIPQIAVDNAASLQFPRSVPASSSLVTQDRNLVRNKGITSEPNPSTFPDERFLFGGASQSAPLESSNSLNFGSVYPLYYGTDYQVEDCLVGINHRDRIHDESQEILTGSPVSRLMPTPIIMGPLKTLIPKETPKIAEQTTTLPCDLSLRLGVLPGLDLDKRKSFAPEASNFPLNMCLSMRNSEDTGSIAEPSVKNNPENFHNFMKDGQFFWQPEPPPDQFSGRKNWPENIRYQAWQKLFLPNIDTDCEKREGLASFPI